MLAPTLYGAVAITMYSARKAQAMPRRLVLNIGKLMDFFVRRVMEAKTVLFARRCGYYDVFSVKAAIYPLLLPAFAIYLMRLLNGYKCILVCFVDDVHQVGILIHSKGYGEHGAFLARVSALDRNNGGGALKDFYDLLVDLIAVFGVDVSYKCLFTAEEYLVDYKGFDEGYHYAQKGKNKILKDKRTKDNGCGADAEKHIGRTPFFKNLAEDEGNYINSSGASAS